MWSVDFSLKTVMDDLEAINQDLQVAINGDYCTEEFIEDLKRCCSNLWSRLEIEIKNNLKDLLKLGGSFDTGVATLMSSKVDSVYSQLRSVQSQLRQANITKIHPSNGGLLSDTEKLYFRRCVKTVGGEGILACWQSISRRS